MSNRKATKARIIHSEPVFQEIGTKFGKVNVKTNRFIHSRGVPTPKYDRIMSQREKEIRKQLRRSKSGKERLTEEQKADLRQELNLILNPPVEV